MWSYIWNRNRLLQRVILNKRWSFHSARQWTSSAPRPYTFVTKTTTRHRLSVSCSSCSSVNVFQNSIRHLNTFKSNKNKIINFGSKAWKHQKERNKALSFINLTLCLSLSGWIMEQTLADIKVKVPTRTEVDEENGFASIKNAPFVHGTYDEIIQEFIPKFNDTDREVVKHLNSILNGCNSYEANFWKEKLVCEIGSGTGILAFPIIEMIGNDVSSKGGYVGLDISSAFVHFLDQEFEKKGLLKTRAIAGRNTPQSLCLPKNIEGKIDIFVICDTYYHLDDAPKTLNEISKYLKKGGKVVIIESRGEEELVTKQMENAGFKLGYEMKSDAFDSQFVSIFKKL